MNQEISYTEIYKEYSPKILRYLKSIFSVEDAEDILQEIFIKVFNSLPGFRYQSKISTWVYKIATNTAIDKLRNKRYLFHKSQSDLKLVDAHFDNTPFAITFHKKLEKDEMYNCIRKFIGELTEKSKIAFVLSEYEGLSNPEISEILQISVASVKNILHRAKASLKGALQKNCNIYFDECSDISCEPK